MVEFFTHARKCALHILEMADETGLGGGLALQPDNGAKRMSVHPPVGMAVFCIGKKMRGIEKELFVNLHHGIPISLWVWRLSRHFGWARQ